MEVAVELPVVNSWEGVGINKVQYNCHNMEGVKWPISD